MTVDDIIKLAGGPKRIAEHSDGSINRDAVYKWPSIGIPDRHWPVLMELSGATAQDLFEANVAARGAPERAAS